MAKQKAHLGRAIPRKRRFHYLLAKWEKCRRHARLASRPHERSGRPSKEVERVFVPRHIKSDEGLFGKSRDTRGKAKTQEPSLLLCFFGKKKCAHRVLSHRLLFYQVRGWGGGGGWSDLRWAMKKNGTKSKSPPRSLLATR